MCAVISSNSPYFYYVEITVSSMKISGTTQNWKNNNQNND